MRDFMNGMYRNINLVLGGGGVKGIAYIGVFEGLENRGYAVSSIAGVSAGALAGTLKAAGFTAQELKKLLYSFDMSGIMVERDAEAIPVVAKYKEYARLYGQYRNNDLRFFFKYLSGGLDRYGEESGGLFDFRGNVFNSILTFGKKGCFCDGDYLEEWVRKVLLLRGIRTFEDLRGGIAGESNPDGYKVLMSAVDINRVKMLVLPYDIRFYGMEPDKLEVAKAVRMSTSVPFAFKPVEMRKKVGNFEWTYNIVDGGVFDKFPCWAVDSADAANTLGFRLDGVGSPDTGLNSPMKILKHLLSAVHDLGVPPKAYYNWENTCPIDTSLVPFLKFDLNDGEKDYLYNAGKYSADRFLNSWEQKALGLTAGRRVFYNPAYNRYFYGP